MPNMLGGMGSFLVGSAKAAAADAGLHCGIALLQCLASLLFGVVLHEMFWHYPVAPSSAYTACSVALIVTLARLLSCAGILEGQWEVGSGYVER